MCVNQSCETNRKNSVQRQPGLNALASQADTQTGPSIADPDERHLALFGGAGQALVDFAPVARPGNAEAKNSGASSEEAPYIKPYTNSYSQALSSLAASDRPTSRNRRSSAPTAIPTNPPIRSRIRTSKWFSPPIRASAMPVARCQARSCSGAGSFSLRATCRMMLHLR